ncbi:Ribosome biogenesis regulatory [Chionoecetes opilio]|uniref:Ribosome biogenesis regulatory protein n=1 Tax=Chionoecetes opilio TaxID=41210 RepID=A0A8J4YDP6_CHIOP|nr:Ribosome biogenesis regulatory [Chionoecetes opilio]
MADTDSNQRVQEILSQASEELLSIKVANDDQLECDLGNLAVCDPNALNETLLREPEKIDSYLSGLARDSVQALLNRVWQLPSERIDNAIYVTLPKQTTSSLRQKILLQVPQNLHSCVDCLTRRSKVLVYYSFWSKKQVSLNLTLIFTDLAFLCQRNANSSTGLTVVLSLVIGMTPAFTTP